MYLVKRIVPESYTPEDSHVIREFTKISGPNGPLLQEVPPFSLAAMEAQGRLLTKLYEHRAEVRQRFDRKNAPLRDAYWIHDAKFSGQLLQFLVDENLAWTSEHSTAYGHRNWYALHPVLGSAVMTTLGLSIAHEQNYDIVTPTVEFHDALIATDEDDIFDVLLSDTRRKPARPTRQASRDLAQLVITFSGVNFKALRPQNIPYIQESKHFRKFQLLIRTRALKAANEEPDAYKENLRLETAQPTQTSWFLGVSSGVS